MSILSHVPVCVSDRRPSVAGRCASGLDLAVAQRAELHLDLSDELLTALAAHVHTAAGIPICPDCSHTAGCSCDCCPYPLPAVVAIVGTGVGS